MSNYHSWRDVLWCNWMMNLRTRVQYWLEIFDPNVRLNCVTVADRRRGWSRLIINLPISSRATHERGGWEFSNISIYRFQTTSQTFCWKKDLNNQYTQSIDSQPLHILMIRVNYWIDKNDCNCTLASKTRFHWWIVTDSSKRFALCLKITRYQWLIQKPSHEITFPNIWHFYVMDFSESPFYLAAA